MKPHQGLAIVVFLCGGCAQVREPSGGPRDAEAPKLLEAAPPQYSTNFSGTRIVLRFNERIRLDRVREKLLVSPPLTTAPEVRLSGASTVLIDLKAPLAPHTTYTFNIGDAVVDLSEGNAAAGLAYVVSTGEHIDSLQLAGGVLNAFTAKTEKDLLVLLYEEHGDTAFRTGMPMYFTRTRSDGTYVLDHVRPGRYRLFALRDQNTNYRYDLPNEEIAFHPDVIDLHAQDSSRHTLSLFREAAASQDVIDARVLPDAALRTVLALPARSATLNPVGWTGGTLTWINEVNRTGDTLLFWPSDTTLLDGRDFTLTVDDVTLDTLRYEQLGKMPFDVALRKRMEPVTDGLRPILVTSRPVRQIDTSRVDLLHDGVSVPADMILDSTDRRRITFGTSARDGSRSLVLLPGAVTDIYGASHDTLYILLGAMTAQESGTLVVKLPVPENKDPLARVVQLLDAQDQVVREEVLSDQQPTVEWRQVPPGSYSLKLIDDLDNDGRWSTGSLALGRRPERVRRYTAPLMVRAGWDVDVEWPEEAP